MSAVPKADNPFPIPGACNLRGDYSRCRPDYTVDQDYSLYTEADQQLWRRLYTRQANLMRQYAAPEFIAGVDAFHMSDSIPHFDQANELLARATGWQLVAVPGLIPNDVFFLHLAEKRFPVSVWLRTPAEFEYLVEPDIFHDFFGHVPLLSNPVFADYMQVYGKKGREAIETDSVNLLSRLYWYMVEFGLIQTKAGLRAFGAGILSSGGETVYSIESPKPLRVAFNLGRVLKTDYRIDRYQDTYFVLDSFEELFRETSRDLKPLYRAAKQSPTIPPTQTLADDRLIQAAA
jgi:phenylalanine-4-hydroxylase